MCGAIGEPLAQRRAGASVERHQAPAVPFAMPRWIARSDPTAISLPAPRPSAARHPYDMTGFRARRLGQGSDRWVWVSGSPWSRTPCPCNGR
jgi:hypothetical protein